MSFFMNKYLILCVLIIIVGSYFTGNKIAYTKCRMQTVTESLKISEQQQKQNIYNQRIVHDKVYKTGVSDIRHILQSKYTIAD